MNTFIYCGRDKKRKENPMRRKDDTLRDTLLDYARELADSEGL